MQLLRLLPFALLASTNALAQAERIFPKSDGSETSAALLREQKHQPADTDKPPGSTPVFYPVPYWTRGILQPYSGPVSRPWLKFDAVKQQLYARSATDEPVLVDMANLRAFALGDSLLGTRRVYRRYLDARMEQAALRTTFFEVAYDAGRTVLLLHRVVADRVFNGRRWINGRERLFYFLKEANSNSLMPIALNQKTLLAALHAAHRLALAAYADKNSLHLNRESDVIRLLAYYDTL